VDAYLEAELFFQDVVEQITVLACLRVVQQVVGAHEGCDPSFDSIGERPRKANQNSSSHAVRRSALPSIYLMHRLVVNV